MVEGKQTSNAVEKWAKKTQPHSSIPSTLKCRNSRHNTAVIKFEKNSKKGKICQFSSMV